MKTVKIKVAVAVDSDGEWVAYGYTSVGVDGGPPVILENMLDHLNGEERYFWLTAELPIPEPEEIPADVEPL